VVSFARSKVFADWLQQKSIQIIQSHWQYKLIIIMPVYLYCTGLILTKLPTYSEL
jgi:hypothetical protein